MHLYDRAYKMCEQIKEVIESGSMQELDDISRNKGELFKSILRFEKTVKTNPEEEALRLEARKKIEHFETIHFLFRNHFVTKNYKAVTKNLLTDFFNRPKTPLFNMNICFFRHFSQRINRFTFRQNN